MISALLAGCAAGAVAESGPVTTAPGAAAAAGESAPASTGSGKAATPRHTPPAGDGSETVQRGSDIERTRRSYLERWRELEGSSGLERFATTVQFVIDTRAALKSGNRDEEVRAVLDDLVDLFVGHEYLLEKNIVMATPSVLGEDAIDEEDGDLTGFAPLFQAGEGRFRHFALNAAASYAVPETLVSLAALLRGRDLQGVSPENEGDSAADIATNRIGREFTRLLRKRPLADLGGGTVREWLIARFGDG